MGRVKISLFSAWESCLRRVYWVLGEGEIKLGLFESYLGKYLGGGREEKKLGIRNILGEYHREGVAVQLLTEVVGGWLKFTWYKRLTSSLHLILTIFLSALAHFLRYCLVEGTFRPGHRNAPPRQLPSVYERLNFIKYPLQDVIMPWKALQLSNIPLWNVISLNYRWNLGG